MDDTILIRDMESGLQETIDFNKVIPEVTKRITKSGVVEVKDSIKINENENE